MYLKFYFNLFIFLKIALSKPYVGQASGCDQDLSNQPESSHVDPERYGSSLQSQKVDGNETPSYSEIELDVNETESTDEYVYELNKETQTHTYLAKEGYCFKLITQGERILKECQNEEIYAKIVVAYSSQGDILLSFYCPDLKFFVFLILRDSFQYFVPTTPSRTVNHSSVSTASDTLTSGFHLEQDLNDLTIKEDLDHGGPEVGPSDMTNMIKYSFNEGSFCKEVKCGGNVLWKHDPSEHGNDYPNSVTLNTHKNLVLIESENKYQYFYSFYNNEWWQIFGFKPIKGVDQNKLSITTSDTRLLNNQTSSLYDLERSVETVRYRFKHGVRCVEVKYDDKIVWKHEEELYGDKYPNSLTLNIIRNFLVIDSSGIYRLLYLYIGEKWNLTFNHRFQSSKPLDINRVKIYTSDDDGIKQEIVSAKYKLINCPNSTIFKFYSGVRVSSITYDNKPVWNYDITKHRCFHPTSVSINKTRQIISVDSLNNYRYIFSHNDGEWNPLPFGFRAWDLSISRLKILVMDRYGNATDDVTGYDPKHYPGYVTFKFYYGTKCVKIEYDGVDVWKHDPSEHGNDYPTNALLNTTTKLLLVESENKYQYFYSYFGGKWKSIFGYKNKMTTEPVDQSKLNFYSPDPDGTYSEIVKGKYDVQHSQNVFTYTFKRGIRCSHVNYGDDTIWKYEEGTHHKNFPTTVTLNLNTRVVMVESFGSYKHFYSFCDDWKSVMDTAYSDKGSVLSLDILKESEFSAIDATEPKKGEGQESGEEQQAGEVKPEILTQPEEGEKVMVDPTTADFSMTGEENGFDQDKEQFVIPEPENEPGTSSTTADASQVSSEILEDDVSKDESPASSDEQPEEEETGTPILHLSIDESVMEESEEAAKVEPEVLTQPKTQVAAPSITEPSDDSSESICDSTLVDLDIGNKSSTLLFSYSENQTINLGTFKVKPGYYFNIIRQSTSWPSKESIVWEPKDESQRSKKVEIDGLSSFSATKNVTLYLNCGVTKRFTKKNKKWVEITPFIDLDLSKDETTDFYFYSKDKNTKTEIFRTKEQYSFKSVKYGKKLIWVAENFDEHFDTLELSNLGNNEKNLILFLPRNKKKRFNRPGKGKPWSETTDIAETDETRSKVQSTPFQSAFKIKTLDPNDNTKTKENDTSQYDFVKKYKMYEFKFEQKTKCVEIELKDVSLWKHDPDKPDEYPKLIRVDVSKKTVSIVFNDNSTIPFQYSDDEWESIFEVKCEPVEIDITKRHSDDQANISVYPNFCIFSPKEGYQFNAVKDDTTLIWKSENEKETAIRLELDEKDTGEKKIKIVLSNGRYKVFTKDKDSFSFSTFSFNRKSWVEEKGVEKIVNLVLSEHPPEIKIKTLDPNDMSQTKDNDISQYYITKYLMEDLVLSYVYQFRSNSKCDEVKWQDTSLWKYDSSSAHGYPESILYDVIEKKNTLWFNNNYIHVYSFDNNQWKSAFSGQRKELVLDIKINNNSDDFDYTIDEFTKTGTYIAKVGNFFRLVSESDEQVWKPHHYSERAKKVVVAYSDGVGSSSVKQVTVYLANNDVRKCEKDKRIGWGGVKIQKNELSNNLVISKVTAVSTESQPSHPLDKTKIKIYSEDPNDASKTVECDTSVYKAKIQDNVIDYEFKPDSKCVRVEYDGVVVWKYDSSAGIDGYPELIVAYLGTKTIFVDLKNKLNVFQQDNNQWKSTFSGKPEPVQLDTKNTKSSDEFNYESKDNVHTYAAKEHFIFNSVMKNGKEIWDTKDFTQYANKLLICSDQTVTIHLLNGDIVRLTIN